MTSGTWPALVCDSNPAVFPEYFRMNSWETLPLTFDCSSVVEPGQQISAPLATLWQLSTGLPYPNGLLSPVRVEGTDLTQVVTKLLPSNRFRLVIQFQTDLDTVWAPYLIIECVA